MDQEDVYLIQSKIEWEGFEYWLEEYSESMLKEAGAPQTLIDICEAAVNAYQAARHACDSAGLLPDGC